VWILVIYTTKVLVLCDAYSEWSISTTLEYLSPSRFWYYMRIQNGASDRSDISWRGVCDEVKMVNWSAARLQTS